MSRKPCPHRLATIVIASVAAGVVLLQVLGWLLLREGLVTIVINEKILRRQATSSASATPETAPVPVADRSRPIAVMIDNHPDALPQSGLGGAWAIWEAPVEGSLTRLMAVYRGGDVPEIGPVRSARPYFLDWAAEADAVYAHVGGSDEALLNLHVKAQGLDDANEFQNGGSFWRDKTRRAPHNAYTSTGKMLALIAKKGWQTETDALDPSLRDTVIPKSAAAATVTVRHDGGGFLTTWRWDAKAGTYVRTVEGKISKTRDGAIVTAPTVITLELKKKKIADPYGKGLIGIETLGTGPATVFRDGVAVEGKWTKATPKAPIEIFTAAGEKIPFRQGLVWFEAVLTNAGGSVSYQQ